MSEGLVSLVLTLVIVGEDGLCERAHFYIEGRMLMQSL